MPPAWAPHHRVAAPFASPTFELDSTASASLWDNSFGSRPAKPGVVVFFGLPTRQAVDDTYLRLVESGHPSEQPPADAFWGARYAIVEDPDGNAVGLMSPIDPSRSSVPEPP